MKRFFDLLVSSVAFLLLSPLLLVLAALIRWKLGSPMFFRQTRPGVGGRPFQMIKFRTMLDAVDESGDPLPDEKRMTRLGHFLRATSLDELPELWNVIKGEMSLVGPRPLLMEYLPLYDAEQMRRHDVRPGITGWAQVNGRNAVSWEEKFKLDLWYVVNESFWLDLKILLLTVKKVLIREGISGEGEATMTRFAGNKNTQEGGVTGKLIGIYGASGFGREVMPLARERYDSDDSELVFIDDNPQLDTVGGIKVFSYTEFLSHQAGEKKLVVAISDGKIRRKIEQRCEEDGVSLVSIHAVNNVILDAVEFGDGSILCPFVTVTSNVKIGKSFHANIYSYVAHDCVIGDYVTFAPAVKCNGNVIIEDNAYIGTGAIIKQGSPSKPIIIGEGAVVGMGAVVTKNVPPGVVVIGNPAKPLGRKGLGG